MKQYELCIQNDNNNNNNIIIIIKWKKNNKKWQRGTDGRGKGSMERIVFLFFFLPLFLSQIYENWTVGFRRS